MAERHNNTDRNPRNNGGNGDFRANNNNHPNALNNYGGRGGAIRRRSSLETTADTCQVLYDTLDKFGVIQLAEYPLIYAELLIKLGYEPFPPVVDHSIWNMFEPHPSLMGVVPYAAYLVRSEAPYVFSTFLPVLAKRLIDSGLHRGLNSLAFSSSSASAGGERAVRRHSLPDANDFDDTATKSYLWMKGKLLLIQLAVTTLTHPIHVVAVRNMANVVGRSAAYSTAWETIKTIVRTEGWPGFFSGLGPMLLADCVYALASGGVFLSLVQLLQRSGIAETMPQVSDEVWEKGVVRVSSLLGTTYADNFRSVSNIMIINGVPSLTLGNPPYITPGDGGSEYKSWLEAWENLPTNYKGAGLFSRTFNGKGSFPEGEGSGPFTSPNVTFGPPLRATPKKESSFVKEIVVAIVLMGLANFSENSVETSF